MRLLFLLALLWIIQPAHPACCSAPGAAADSIDTPAASVEDSLRREADILFARQEYDQAAGLYRRIIEADSLDSRAVALLGSCLMRSGRPGPAVNLFTRALALEPKLRLAYLGLVYSYYRLGRLDSSRIWADSCRSMLAGPQRDEWEKMMKEFFPLIFPTEDK